MVVFTCEACNESLKKNKVEAHLFRCRRAKHVTCIDCQADFDCESYKEHTSCISEVEKYSGPGYVAKASANKGAKKQDDWFQRVQSAIDSCARLGGNQQQLAGVLNKVRESSNVPRKQAKFVNFCRNSMKWASPAVIQQAWNLLSAQAAAPAPPKAEMKPAEEAGQKEPVETADKADEQPETKTEKHRKFKKRRLDDEENPAEADDEQQKTEKKHKKKRKPEEENDRQSVDAETEAADQQAEIDLQAEVDQQDDEIDQLVEQKMKKKKKAKKQHHQLADDDAVVEAAESNGGGSEKRKHKKRRRRQDDASEAAELSVA